MASPPHKFSKLSHDPARDPTLAKSASKLSLNHPNPPPLASPPKNPSPVPRPAKKRLGLSTASNGVRDSKSGPKKLTLKPKQPQSSAATATTNSLEQAIVTLTRAVRSIQSRPPEPTRESFSTLYSLCEFVVAQGRSASTSNNQACQTLYDRVRIEIERKTGEIKKLLLALIDINAGDAVADAVDVDSATPNSTRKRGKVELEKWLQEFVREGNDFLNQILLVRSIFLHLDRTFVLDSPHLLSIWDLGLDIFQQTVLRDEVVSRTVTESLLTLIELERAGDYISRPLLRSFLQFLHTISSASSSTITKQARSLATQRRPQLVSDLFVDPLLRSTRDYYSREASTLVVQHETEPGNYLKRILERIEQEGERCDQVFDIVSSTSRASASTSTATDGSEARPSSLKGSILEALEDEMIKGHVEGIAEKDTAEMYSKAEHDNLRNLYTLLNRIGRIEVLRKAFLEHLKVSGLNLIQDKTRDDRMVPNLIEFRKTAVECVETCFSPPRPSSTMASSSTIDGDDETRRIPRSDQKSSKGERAHLAQQQLFKESINDAFKFFINKRENKPAEMMAKYLDSKLRSGKIDDNEMEQTLNDVLYLFRFTQGKDIFEAFYKRDLAKRLLLNKSASFDAERSMLLKLKDECGAGFTQKLEIMFKDMELSSDVMRAYTATKQSQESGSFDLSVSVLSQGNWPSYPPFPIELPARLQTALETFKRFYISKHSGRTLTWCHSLDTCSLKAQFPNSRKGKGASASTSKKELLVSLGQAVVLLLFNDVEDDEGEGAGPGKLSVQEIAQATKLESKELIRTLQSLACGKVRVLVKHPKGRDVNPGDKFSFNHEFKDDHVRIKINQIQQKETQEENKSTTDRVFTDRSSHLQLAIVRIMKARKTLKHSELVMEVVSQIGQRFKVDPTEIKKSISSLIDREYLRRAEGQLNVYEYLA